MTLWDLLRAIVGRWPVLLVGMLCTAALGYLLTRGGVVYMSQAQVVFLAPSSARYPNSLSTESEGLIITAGAVAKRVVGPAKQLRYADPSVDIVGTPGPDRGYWIRLPNAGGQWGTDYQDRLLLVDSAGRTPREAEVFLQDAIGKIETQLDTMQRNAGVARVNYITVTVSPESPAVREIKGSRVRAGGMSLALGGFGTVSAVVLLEMRARRRKVTKRLPMREDDHSHLEDPSNSLEAHHSSRTMVSGLLAPK